MEFLYVTGYPVVLFLYVTGYPVVLFMLKYNSKQ